jgi:hypothetical protein
MKRDAALERRKKCELWTEMRRKQVDFVSRDNTKERRVP